MSRYTLAVVGIAGIQEYIFGTNSLRQNVGASYLVDCAARKWVMEALPTPHNVVDFDSKVPLLKDEAIENGELEAEVIYAGGGNALILFASRDLATRFARCLTRNVLLSAPGLQVVVIHEEFNWQREPLGGKSGVVGRALRKQAVRKADGPVSIQTLGLGVTARCAFTGLPAVDSDEEGRLISAEVKAKLHAELYAHGRLMRLIDFAGYDVPKDFDDFGRTEGESSYIAVVHTDGNAMGKRIEKIRDDYPTAEKNREYVRAVRMFSGSVQMAALEALQSTVDRLVKSVRTVEGKKLIGGVIEVRENKLPIRPIVFGGDDLTFVCDGRLGLSLAAHYLDRFSSCTLHDGEPAYCRGGVAVVRTHYPFARAYALAEALCSSAKEYIKKRQQPPYDENGLTAMDWHFAVSGLVRGLRELREREYSVRAGSLLMRPVRLTNQEKDWHSWSTFCRIVREFQAGEQWAERRNKIKALRDALRVGPQAVRNLLALYGPDELRLPPIPGEPDMERQGWHAAACGYFDPIEAVDFFVPLEGGEQQ